jgi:hypothetical protein
MNGPALAGLGLAVVLAGSGHHATGALDAAQPQSRVAAHQHHHKSAPTAAPAQPARLPVTDGSAPVAFTANAGNVDQSVRFLAEGSGYHLYLTDQDAVLALHTPNGSSPVRIGVLHLRPVGAASGRAVTSSDRRHVAVTHQVWPGIDWSWHGTANRTACDLTLSPGVAAKTARFEAVDARSLRLDRQGNLLITTVRGVLTLPAPTAWQTAADGSRQPVQTGYVLLGANRFGFRLGAHDASRPVTVESAASS